MVKVSQNHGIIVKDDRTKTIVARLYADTKEEVQSEMSIIGLLDGYTLAEESFVVTANGEVAILKSDGTWQWIDQIDLETLLPTLVNQSVAIWLSTHVDPATGYVLDSTLTQPLAAAPAKTVGDKLGEIKSALSDFMMQCADLQINLKDDKYWSQGTIATNGSISSAHTQSNIYTNDIYSVPLSVVVGYRQTAYVAKYLDGVFVERSNISDNKIEPDGTTFNGYRIMLIYGDDTQSLSDMISTAVQLKSFALLDYEDVKEKLDFTRNGATFLWNKGVIGNNGSITTPGTSDNYYSDLIKKSSYESIDISCRSGFHFSICEYTDAGVFVSRSSWYANTDGVITTSNKNIRVNIACIGAGSGRTIEQMLVNFAISAVSLSAKYAKEIAEYSKNGVDFLNKTYAGMTPNKICHYSIDDTYAILKDLIDNAETYTSIFDNATLAGLKSVHESTGMCVTLNTFNSVTSVPTYSISDVPENTTFKSEFQANKDWLKFAFHGEDDNSNYNTSSGISTAYDTFVAAIYKLTGDYDCIDRFTRLGYFGGSLANVLTIKNKTYGIKGLLCADATNRDSYYLSSDQNAQIQSKGMLLDLDNELIFIKTITRTLANAPEEIEDNLCYQKFVEVFSHEYESSLITSCQTICTWLKNNGYVFAFPSLILS